jgi:PAS domain S-box-containing protein
MSAKMHRLLERQLRKSLAKLEGFPPDLQKLLDAVDAAYRQNDADRALLERSMELSSGELLERNQALTAAEEKYRTIFENATEGIFQIGPDGAYLSANPALAHILGYDGAHDLMAAVTDVATQLYVDAGRAAEIRGLIARDGRVSQAESQVRRKDGSIIWISETTRAVIRAGGAGQLVRYEGTALDVTHRKAAEAERQTLQSRLIEISRQSGMADVATSVLHNIGNVLNSVDVSVAMASKRLRGLRIAGLSKVAEMLGREREGGQLGGFFADGGKGQQIPGYLGSLAGHLTEEQQKIQQELTSLAGNLDHIKRIVAMQQTYAKMAATGGAGVSGVNEIVQLADLVEDALRLNKASFEQAEVHVVREFQQLPPVNVDKHHIMQILVNLISNAKYAMRDTGRDRTLTIRVGASAGEPQRLFLTVKDTGVGIPKQNLTRIFNHGFTTKPEGHGFGLHGSALAATALGGTLTVESDGPDTGASFTLEIPLPQAKNSSANSSDNGQSERAA